MCARLDFFSAKRAYYFIDEKHVIETDIAIWIFTLACRVEFCIRGTEPQVFFSEAGGVDILQQPVLSGDNEVWATIIDIGKVKDLFHEENISRLIGG